MNIKTYDITAKEQDAYKVDDAIIGEKSINNGAFSQYVHIHRQKVAQNTRKTKDRGEASGGGRKPWRQKGTGRARAGSNRSPVWVGGGHTHAIVPNPNKRVMYPKALKQVALKSALSYQAKMGALHIVNGLSVAEISTKKLIDMLKPFNFEGTVLIVTELYNEKMYKSARNADNVVVTNISELHPVMIANARNVVFVDNALSAIVEKLTA